MNVCFLWYVWSEVVGQCISMVYKFQANHVERSFPCKTAPYYFVIRILQKSQKFFFIENFCTLLLAQLILLHKHRTVYRLRQTNESGVAPMLCSIRTFIPKRTLIFDDGTENVFQSTSVLHSVEISQIYRTETKLLYHL